MAFLNKIISDYKFIEFINEGGFGAVYKAEKNGHLYAIKVFREAYVLREFRKHGDNSRIKREIEIMKSVSHPSIVKYVDDFVYDEKEEGGKNYCLVMEFINGKNLRQLLNENGKFNEESALDIFCKILDGVNYLHNLRGDGDDAGIIHRDLKPENILIMSDGEIKIVDFGLSKIIDFTSITSTGEVFGTGPYMSPEQIMDSKHIDKRSDYYTLGVILYEMLTEVLPYDFQVLPELLEKIKNDPAIPPRRRESQISNHIENVILKLLEKNPYQRYSKVQDIFDSIKISFEPTKKKYDLSPKFILRLYDDKSVLEQYTGKHPDFGFVEFPANLENHQKGLKKIIQENSNIKIIVDPATIRLAYDTYTDTKGLCELPYAPQDYSVITPNYLRDYKKQQEYVKQVIDKEVELQANTLLTPFHYTHNSSVVYTPTSNPIAEWFDLDCKLIKESIDYRNSKYPSKAIYAGVCIKADSLKDEGNRRHLLNTFSSFDCDGFMIYADCIDNETGEIILYHYFKFLHDLQRWTERPVLAGRVNIGLGLGLISFGLAGFTSGTARFESFYEDLYKDRKDAYNMGVKYYFPELLSTVYIKRKEPIRFEEIAKVLGTCNCIFCKGKSTVEIIKDQNTKLHFLECTIQEIGEIKNLGVKDRMVSYLSRIKKAQENYAKLKMVFKPEEYMFLSKWKKFFTKLNEEYNV
ncbi:MAG: serine/threonine-protein kinase [Phycisphaerae bacterium]|jgi:serine/threonine-protein kinase